jgi:hypothetical protein
LCTYTEMSSARYAPLKSTHAATALRSSVYLSNIIRDSVIAVVVASLVVVVVTGVLYAYNDLPSQQHDHTNNTSLSSTGQLFFILHSSSCLVHRVH